jgi:rod shape-determining protein MreC
MNFFTFDLRKVLIVIILIILPLITINLQRRSEETLWFLRPFTFAAGLVDEAYSSFSSGVRGTTSLYLDLINIKKENRTLQTENQELRAKLGTMTELEMENKRLNDLLGFKQKTAMALLAAKVIGKDVLNEHNTIVINRGLEHGVKKNMAVLTVGGAVGYVFRPENYSSQIMLLTDRYAAIDALVQRSRARGILEGRTRDDCQMHYLKRDDDVKEGDLVVTSGLNNIFPKGFPIGSVVSTKRSKYGMSQEVDVKPAVNPQNLEEVFVVLNANQEDFTPQPPAPDNGGTQ